MTVPAPDPQVVRDASLQELARLGLPLPPAEYPMVWEPGDQVGLRPTAELEARAAVLHLIQARCFGMPPQTAMSWLLGSRLTEQVTAPEWQFITLAEGDHRSFVLHHEALFALSWVLGLAAHIDPTVAPDPRTAGRFPDLAGGETFDQWRARTLAAPRAADEAAQLLDLYYCLDWSFLHAEREGLPLPGELDANAIGQRRWALEWAVVLVGPYHEDPPPGWEEVDLST